VSRSSACFVTPPSKLSVGGGGNDERPGVQRSEGQMPVETKEPGKSMGSLRKQHEIALSSDSLQRALEMEIVSQLWEQNAV
jgi:hypothetical protein